MSQESSSMILCHYMPPRSQPAGPALHGSCQSLTLNSGLFLTTTFCGLDACVCSWPSAFGWTLLPGPWNLSQAWAHKGATHFALGQRV